MPKRKHKKEGTPESPAVSAADDTELIAVITAAIAAAGETEAPVPVVTAVREREVPEPSIAAARETEVSEAAREEEMKAPADSFVVRTIKRRDKRKNGRSPRL